jgi:hypothetical protein
MASTSTAFESTFIPFSRALQSISMALQGYHLFVSSDCNCMGIICISNRFCHCKHGVSGKASSIGDGIMWAGRSLIGAYVWNLRQ